MAVCPVQVLFYTCSECLQLDRMNATSIESAKVGDPRDVRGSVELDAEGQALSRYCGERGAGARQAYFSLAGQSVLCCSMAKVGAMCSMWRCSSILHALAE